MRSFDEKLLRLKQALRTTEDQEVAAALGMSKAAMAQRKKRGAFPDDKVAALAVARPDLRIDVQQVLTGRTAAQVAAELAAQVLTNRTPASQTGPAVLAREAAGPGYALPADDQALLRDWRDCSPADRDALRQLAASLAAARRR